jgi:hypothetical protein
MRVRRDSADAPAIASVSDNSALHLQGRKHNENLALSVVVSPVLSATLGENAANQRFEPAQNTPNAKADPSIVPG